MERSARSKVFSESERSKRKEGNLTLSGPNMIVYLKK